jgi:hypothetical protein
MHRVQYEHGHASHCMRCSERQLSGLDLQPPPGMCHYARLLMSGMHVMKVMRLKSEATGAP